jgi:hypothetical protein
MKDFSDDGSKIALAMLGVVAVAGVVKASSGSRAKPPTAKSAVISRGKKRIPKPTRRRAAQLKSAIDKGKISVRQGITKPTEAPGATPYERTLAFNDLYRGVSTGRKKRRK